MEKMGVSGVLCDWIMEGMVWGVVWKGWELKGVDGGRRRPDEWIGVETNRQWIDELIVHDNNRSK